MMSSEFRICGSGTVSTEVLFTPVQQSAFISDHSLSTGAPGGGFQQLAHGRRRTIPDRLGVDAQDLAHLQQLLALPQRRAHGLARVPAAQAGRYGPRPRWLRLAEPG